MDGWMDGWMDEWMYGWMDRWMDGWMVFINFSKSFNLYMGNFLIEL